MQDMMDLDGLKQKWAEHDRKLDVNIRLTRQLLTTTKLNRAQSALWRLAAFLTLEAAVALAVVVVLGSFIGDQMAAPRFWMPAAMLDLFEIGTVIVLGQQIRLALQIDYGKPIATIQKQLALLRMLSIRSIQWTLLLAPLLWTPLMIVALKGLLGVDAYKILGASYLSACLLLGVAIIPTVLWLSKKFSERMGGSPMIQRLMRSLAGHNLNAASDFLAALSEFEDEKQGC